VLVLGTQPATVSCRWVEAACPIAFPFSFLFCHSESAVIYVFAIYIYEYIYSM
jgi:hypothetical protein